MSSQVNSLEIKNISKSFGSVKAVNDVSLTVKPAEVIALIGENGAGKTTLIKLIVGLLTPSHGSIVIQGVDLGSKPTLAKANFGYVPDDPTIYEYLTGTEFLTLAARLRGLEPSQVKKRVEELSHVFAITKVLPQTMTTYSRGNKQKVVLLTAIITNPPLLIIDEPIVGLDPKSITIIEGIIRNYQKSGKSVLMATHTLWFASKLATRTLVMHEGRLIADSPLKDLKNLETL